MCGEHEMTTPGPGGIKNPLNDRLQKHFQYGVRDEASRRNVAFPGNDASPHAPVPVVGQRDRTNLILGAKEVQRMRNCRAAYLPKEMFGESPWEILLSLYVEDERRRLSLSALAVLIEIPLTSLLRWISYLEGKSLVQTVAAATDARLRLVMLTEAGRRTMDDCMIELLRH